jgi:WD40 domain-containing protein
LSTSMHPIRVWDLGTNKEIARLLQHLQGLDIAYPENEEELLVFCSAGRGDKGFPSPIELKVIDLKRPNAKDGRPTWKTAVKLSASMATLVFPAFDRDRHRAILSDPLGAAIRCFDTGTGELLWSLPDRIAPVNGVSIGPAGSRVAYCNVNGGFYIMDARNGHILNQFKDPKATVPGFMSDDRRIVYGSQAPGQPPQIVIRDCDTKQEVLRINVPSNAVNNVIVSPDGRWIAAMSQVERVVFIFDAQSGKELLTFRGPRDKLLCQAFSPDSRSLAVGTENAKIHIWRIDPFAE